jgi:hypothetical protein
MRLAEKLYWKGLTMEIAAFQALGLIFMHPEDITSLEING